MSNDFHFKKNKNTKNNNNILKQFIDWFVSNREEDCDGEVYNYQLKNFKNFLFNVTTLENLLNHNLISFYDIHWDLYFSVFYKPIPPKNIINSFFNFISNQIEILLKDINNKKPISVFEFVFVTNFCDLDEISFNFFKISLNEFHKINIVNCNYLNFLNQKSLNNYKSVFRKIKEADFETFYIPIKARSERYAYKEAIHISEIYLGYLSFVLFNQRMIKGKVGFSNIWDFSINNFRAVPIICFKKEKNKYCVDKFNLNFKDEILNDLKKDHVKFNITTDNLENLKNFNNYLKLMQKDIKTKFLEFCAIYHVASIEKRVTISFLAFWALMESIVKMNSHLKDKIFKKRLIYFYENFVEYPKTIYPKTDMNSLFDKRNDHVHEAKFNEDVSDRNLIKQIVDVMMLLFLKNSRNVKSLTYFDKKVYKWPNFEENENFFLD